MSKLTGITQEGKESARCLDNTGRRRFLVIEQDSGKEDEQAAVIMHLAEQSPLALVVRSGGKSLHSWFPCGGATRIRRPTVFRPCRASGADRATWTPCQLVRMPDGVRNKPGGKRVRQSVLVLEPFCRGGVGMIGTNRWNVNGEDLDEDEPQINPIPAPCSLKQLVFDYPALRPPVIDGLLRVGETANVIASSKRGKSWLVSGLALSVVDGRRWLDTFSCTKGRVLILDAELHKEVIAHRIPVVAKEMGLPPEQYQDFIDVVPLRGLGIDLLRLRPFIRSIEPDRYVLVILDAWYRFLPVGFSENDNGQVMSLYNQIDAYTAHLQSGWVNIHHTSKGDQANKSVTDVGSGAGSQSRAADTHLIIRPHEDENVAVIEAAVRSFPPVAPIAVRWTFPLWELDTAADPRKLKGLQASKELRRPRKNGTTGKRPADDRQRDGAYRRPRNQDIYP